MNRFIVTVTLLCCFAAGAADHIRLKSGDRTLYFSGENGRLLGVAAERGLPPGFKAHPKGCGSPKTRTGKPSPASWGILSAGSW